LEPAVRGVVDDFLRDALRSKPLGFYTWTPALQAAFRQDRLLQGMLPPEAVTALARALDRTEGGWLSYDACLRLTGRLTNPAARGSLREANGPRAFFPPSRSHEGDLVERLFGDRPVPTGFDLMTELIHCIRDGSLRLEPGAESGWYDHQTWSLEPLASPDRVPEATHLQLGDRYRRHLEDLFRGALALTRETHVKGVALSAAGCIGPRTQPIWVNPNLSVEPLSSLYARRAACYRFVRSVLEEAFGSEALHKMHRLTAEGRASLASRRNSP